MRAAPPARPDQVGAPRISGTWGERRCAAGTPRAQRSTRAGCREVGELDGIRGQPGPLEGALKPGQPVGAGRHVDCSGDRADASAPDVDQALGSGLGARSVVDVDEEGVQVVVFDGRPPKTNGMVVASSATKSSLVW